MFEQELSAHKLRLLNHPLYQSIESMDDLRVFMESHVFAVWDFMSLVKRLQQALTCTTLPWFPPEDGESARFINEINLAEESDVNRLGNAASHLEMYLEAMQDIDADTSPFRQFLEALHESGDADIAFDSAQVPLCVVDFVRATLDIAMHGTLEDIAAYFLYGREDAIPMMFASLLTRWKIDEKAVPGLVYYLKRHIELDGDEHGPLANRLLQKVINHDPEKQQRALNSAIRAMESRIALWDGILGMIRPMFNQQMPAPPKSYTIVAAEI